MTTTDRTRWRKRRHAEEGARRAQRDAGPRSAVAEARGKDASTVSHECTDRCDPELLRAYLIAIDLEEHPETTARPLVDAMDDMVELSGIVLQPDDSFIERGVYLIDLEHELDGLENVASMTSQLEHAAALRRYAPVVRELPLYLEEAELRGIDLTAEWRTRKCPRRQASHVTGAASPRGDVRKVTTRATR